MMADLRNLTEKQKAQYNAQKFVKDAKYKQQSEATQSFGRGLLDVNSFMPVTGDIQSGLLAANDVKNGDYKSAALNGLGLLPFVPSLAGTIASKGEKLVNALDDYAMAHRPPMKGNGAPLHDLTGDGNFYPDDVYSVNGAQYYGIGDRQLDKEAWDIAKNVRGKPDSMVNMYRAVPNSVESNVINNGDWVTTSKKYAKQHGESWLKGDYKILSQQVPARKLFTNGDSWAEYGYDETGKIAPETLGLLAVGSGAGVGYAYNKNKQ